MLLSKAFTTLNVVGSGYTPHVLVSVSSSLLAEGKPFSNSSWLSFNTSSLTLPKLTYNLPPVSFSVSSLNGSMTQNWMYSMFAASKSVVIKARCTPAHLVSGSSKVPSSSNPDE